MKSVEFLMCEDPRVLFCSRSLAKYLTVKYVGEHLVLTMGCKGIDGL